MVEEKVLWFAAVDWGSEKHQACVLDAQGGIAGEREFSHSGAGLAELCDWIVSITGEVSTVAVALEVPHGPVVDTLLDRGFAVYSINPKQLDRLRDRFGVAGAKDDRRDARVCADGLRNDRHLFRRLQVADPRIVELRDWSRLAEELQQERVRRCAQARSVLGQREHGALLGAVGRLKSSHQPGGVTAPPNSPLTIGRKSTAPPCRACCRTVPPRGCQPPGWSR